MRRNKLLVALAFGLSWAGSAGAQPVGMIEGAYQGQATQRLKASLAASDLFDDKALHVVLCGTGSPLPDPLRAKACTAVIVKGRAYIVDVGPGAVNSLMLMGFPLDHVAGVFLTHFHSDHIGDLGELRMQSWAAGRAAPLVVHGPEGVSEVTAGFNRAYALDGSYRTLHHGAATMPPKAAALTDDSFTASAGGRVVYQDGDVKVTAFPVKHDPVRPAVAYRFDAGGRSVVISGDTAPTPELVAAAKGADLLVSEALSLRMVEALKRAATAAGATRQAKIFGDIETYHTDPKDVAAEANAAGVKLLVYSHLAPGLPQPVLEKLFFDGVDAVRERKSWLVGFDGLRLDLPFNGGEPVQGKLAILGRN